MPPTINAVGPNHVSIKITTTTTKKERYLPAEILLDILVRLPASSLQKLKFVNKQWFRILSDPDFAEEHLLAHNRELGFILSYGNYNNYFISKTEEEAEAEAAEAVRLPNGYYYDNYGFSAFLHRSTILVGSCKGLVLCRLDNQGGSSMFLHVVNPITRKRLWLPCLNADLLLITASIGCSNNSSSSSSSREIKVVVLGVRNERLLALVVTIVGPPMTLRRWRKVVVPAGLHKNRMTPYKFNKPQPVLARGAFHWTYDTGILSFDLNQEMFSMTNVTFSSFDRLRHHNILLELDGCLAVVTGCPCLHPAADHRIIWVLRDSSGAVWKEELHLGVDFASFGLPCPSVNYSLGRAVLSLRGGELIVFCKEEEDNVICFLAYDVGRGETTTYAQFDRREHLQGGDSNQNNNEFSIMTHTNSIVSCKANNSCSCCCAILKVLLIVVVGAVLIRVLWHYIRQH